MRITTFSLILLISVLTGAAQAPLHEQLARTYDEHCEVTITDRRFKQADIAPLIQQLRAPFRVAVAGQSIEGRDIYRVEYGEGPVKVLLWSQMHGDESTATMALFDIFNFLRHRGDEFDAFRDRLRTELTLVFLPMLNPDGAERFQRRNALGIDLNRDAQRLQCPESKILKRVRDELSADWGFNLHDQSRYYAAGRQPQPATVSFLAPAFNYAKDINDIRERAMRLIGLMDGVLQEYIPGRVARYDDAFEPRAFGDNITKWGTSTILIESGGLAGDPEKQQIRKYNYLILLSAFDAIARQAYATAPVDAYWQIPENDYNAFHDLILREVEVESKGDWYTVDIAIRRNEIPYNRHRQFYYDARISELGDLSVYHAYHNFAGRGYRAVPGRIYPTVLPDRSALMQLDPVRLLREGYAEVRLENYAGRRYYADLPLLVQAKEAAPANELFPGRRITLLLQREGRNEFAVVNGKLYDLADANGIRRAFR